MSSLDSLTSDLECPVCLKVPRSGDLMQCSNQHSICEGCFQGLRARGLRNCPVCRSTYPGARPSVNRLANRLLDKVVLSCENAVNGCPVRGTRAVIRRHEETCVSGALASIELTEMHSGTSPSASDDLEAADVPRMAQEEGNGNTDNARAGGNREPSSPKPCSASLTTVALIAVFIAVPVVDGLAMPEGRAWWTTGVLSALTVAMCMCCCCCCQETNNPEVFCRRILCFIWFSGLAAQIIVICTND